MALAPDLQTIFESYDFDNAEKVALRKYLAEEARQLDIEADDGDANYAEAHELYEKLDSKTKDFVEESNSYMTSWHYGTLDIVEALRDMLNELERS